MTSGNNMSNDIRDSVAMSETIKQAAALARQVHLRSLNAMFTARHYGDDLLGFVTVTQQLRRFSADLERATGALLRRIADLIERATEVQRQSHRFELARKALADCGDQCGSAYPETVRRRIQATRETHQRNALTTRRHLQRDLRSALQLCVTGDTLTVLAKMESAGRPPLQAVAIETAELIERIHTSLATLDGVRSDRIKESKAA